MNRLLMTSAVFLPVLLQAQSALQIIEPGSGSVIRPGDTVVVALQTGTPYSSLLLTGGDALKTMQMLTAPPYRFSVQIPQDIVAGRYQLWAMGCKRPGECEVIDGVTIDVEPIWHESADGSRVVKDDPGVTVDTGGFPVRHRSAIAYPREAIERGIGGTIVAEITPDWEGHIEGTQILSGPDELRKDVIEALLLWHLPREAGEKPRQVKIEFDPVVAYRSLALQPTSQPVVMGTPNTNVGFWQFFQKNPAHTLMSVLALGLSEDARTALLNRIPVEAGQPMDTEAIGKIANTVHNVDNDLILWEMPIGNQVAITITAPGFWLPDVDPAVKLERVKAESSAPAQSTSTQFTPQRIKVAPNIQAAKLISKVEPEYPPIAKANHIQGVVRFTVITGKDGQVELVSLLSGHPLLVDAARHAVSQWAYSPTYVNGSLVEVLTDVEVEFFLPN